MDRNRWILATGLVALLGLTAGCLADEVVYVDEQGNELGVDLDGLGPEGGSEAAPADPKPFVPYVVEERIVPDKKPGDAAADATTSRPPPVRIERPAPSARDTTGTPKPDPNWDLPPAGAAKPPLDTAPATPKVQSPTVKPPVKKKAPAKKKLDSSAGLDLPPAG